LTIPTSSATYPNSFGVPTRIAPLNPLFFEWNMQF